MKHTNDIKDERKVKKENKEHTSLTSKIIEAIEKMFTRTSLDSKYAKAY